MKCSETTKLLDAYIDQELFLKDSLDIEKHLKSCPACKLKYQNASSLQDTLKLCGKYNPSPGLQEKIQYAIGQETPAKILLLNQAWWKFGGPSFAVGAVLSFLLLSHTMVPGDNDNLATNLASELQSSHVRSLMMSHLLDVSSADKHKLKPWLNTVLDFSPPIEDLALQGFDLLGARLDYIQNTQAVALVYQIRNHYINLLIWPSETVEENGTYSFDEKYHGYNLKRWKNSSLNYAAISDLNEKEMSVFVQRYKEKASIR